MGAACCAAAKDRTIVNGPHVDSLQRHTRYSSSWSVRWENCRRVAGEETSTNRLHDGGGGNAIVEVKSSTTVEASFASHEGSPLGCSQSLSWRKSPVSEGNAGVSRLQASDQAISQGLLEVKEPTESPPVSHLSPIKLSPSAHSLPSVTTLPSQSHVLPAKSTPIRCCYRSPGHQLLLQASDSQIPGYNSPTVSISEEGSFPPAWANDLTRGSNGGSSDSWSIPIFSDLITTRRDRWSLDSENSSFCRDKITRSSGHHSMSSSIDLQACGVCTKLLTERSIRSWTSQKIISTNELTVVSVLICGHVYHAECLEYITPEINKYDPTCPVCTYGDKRAAKMFEKALKAELDLKARKRSRKRVVDSDSDIVFDHPKSSGVGERGPKINSSSSRKSLIGKPFVKRHFSFGSKESNSVSENQLSRRKSFFWARSSKN